MGFPIGGTRFPDRRHLPPLVEIINRLDAAWASEHCSFNRAAASQGPFFSGMLLPPRQTLEGAAAAARSISSVAAHLPVPFAIETGVSYLRPRDDEIPDGMFLAEIIAAADCGILLDLHNLWANELNGRQPVDEFLAQIPLERVVEVHLAGGREHQGFWLDAHCGPVPPEVMALAAEVVPALPNLGAVIFEMLPDFVDEAAVNAVRTQLETVHDMWRTRSSAAHPPADARTASSNWSSETGSPPDDLPSPVEWEDTLAALVVRHPQTDGRQTRLAAELGQDPGVEVLQMLVDELRAGMIARALKLSTRLLLLHLGEAGMRRLLAGFWQREPPQMFALHEAEAFRDYLADCQLGLPHHAELVDFELAVMHSAIDGGTRTAWFRNDPVAIISEVTEGRLPSASVGDPTWVQVTVDE